VLDLVGNSKGMIVARVLLIAAVGAQPIQQPPPRDAAPSQQQQPGVVRGRVLDEITNRPVPRAIVRLNGARTGVVPSKGHSTTADSEGQFEFTGVTPGVVAASAQKSGYLAGTHPQPTGLRSFRTPTMLKSGGSVEIVIRMSPAAAVSGRILDSHGDPVEHVEVTILRAGESGSPPGSARTNDLGEFRIPRLRAGNYLLLAVPSEPEDATASPEPPLRSLPTFYPGAEAAGQAVRLRVDAGQQLSNVDLVLLHGRPAVVKGLAVSPEGAPIRSGLVNAHVILPELPNGIAGSSALIREDGSFRLELAPGNYQLHATTDAHSSSSGLNGLAELTVASNTVQDVTLAMGPGAVVTGRVIFDGEPPARQPGPVRVQFTAPYPGGCRSPGLAEVSEDWTFKLEGLLGTCRAPVMSTFGRWTLTSVMIDGQEMKHGTMKFEPGQRVTNVHLSFSDRRGAIKLRVADGKGQLTQEYVALVFPADREKWIPWKTVVWPFTPLPEGLRQFAAATGQRLSQEALGDIISLAVGEYYVLALDDVLLQSQMGDPEFLERLVPSATRVTVSEGTPREVLLQRRSSSDLK
jgi:protocatechuate 3,4-dioxygenase beta subunit